MYDRGEMKHILTETIYRRTQKSPGPRLRNVARCNHIPSKEMKYPLRVRIRWMANRKVKRKMKQFFTFESIVQLPKFFYRYFRAIDCYDSCDRYFFQNVLRTFENSHFAAFPILIQTFLVRKINYI